MLIAPAPRAVLDACVLYPAPLRDLFMHLSVARAFEARWTETIHDEWTRNLLLNRPDLTIEQVGRTRKLMNDNAAGSLVSGYAYLIDQLTLPDPDDRHVLAAAIIAEADVIVTFNLSDFPVATLATYEIAAKAPDAFLRELYAANPTKVIEAVRNQRQGLRNPPRTVLEILQTLTANGLPRFVAALEAHTGEL